MILISFSGIGYSTIITDAGTVTVSNGGNWQKSVFTWYLVKFNNNHVVWHFNQHSIYYKGGVWHTWAIITTLRDYSKYSSNQPIKMSEHVYSSSKLGKKSAAYTLKYYRTYNAYQFYKLHKLNYEQASADQGMMIGGFV